MIDFDNLLAQSQNTSIEDIQQHIDDQDTKKNWSDDFYKQKTDEAGNARSEIRFMPTPPGEKSPFVQYYEHYFKGPSGKVYSELSLTTIGQKDPVGEANSKLWNSGYEADKDEARRRGRRQKFVANILVVRDPAQPEKEGKVYKFRFGKKIMDKIKKSMSPDEGYEDEKINPFDLLATGANFRLVQKKVAGYPNYDDSQFGPKGALYGGDRDKMRRVFDGQELKSLAEQIDPSKFKSYEDLKKRFLEVMDESAEETTSRAEDLPTREERRPEPKREEPRREEPAPKADTPSDEDGDLEFFRNLAKKN